jgi:hypothetical protein
MQSHVSTTATMDRLRAWITTDRVLMALSIAWASVLAVFPALPTSADAFFVTAFLIGVNFLVSTWKLLCRARIYIGLNIAQFALFGLLNYQLYHAAGAEHYRCERMPTTVDWIEFTGAHVLRAADVLDAVDQYGIDIQHIRHASPAAGSILVLMHLAVDAFLISLVGRWLARLCRPEPCENKLREGRKIAGWVLLALALYLACGLTPGWRRIDWVLWPLDNVIRVVDVGDVLQIFHWRLHEVRDGPLTNTAAVVFRLAVGILLGRLIFLVRMVWLRGAGLTVDELIEELEEAEPPIRRGAAVGLGKSGPEEYEAVLALAEALKSDSDKEVRLAVVQSLAQMGPDARHAVPALITALEEIYPEIRETAIETLTLIGSDAVPALKAAQASRCSWVRNGASEVLRRMEAATAPLVPNP